MANTPTTPASVASRLTDNEILKLAEQHTRIDSRSLPQFIVDRCKESAAVLRDYVRLRNDNAKLRVDADLYKGAAENWERKYRSAKARLDAVVKECENEISKRNQTSERCKRCADDFSEGEGCPYHGEPNGCNSPTHGEFPSEKECGPFKAILRAARGEGGAE